ncbi:hypothetical protein ZTR_10286 [Talaromyces verruculosus]|nr:hypothetical protein ZTR_10286 [Talaromyces verruculosus]
MGLSNLALDVTSKQSIDECKTRVEQLKAGRLDILRTPCVIPALDFGLSDAKNIYDTNIFGPMLVIQACINLLIRARGLLINNSSASTEMPSLLSSVYSSSKAALNAYSTVLRIELKPFNVRVMVSTTGTVGTNMPSKVEQSLPPTSLYATVNDMYQRVAESWHDVSRRFCEGACHSSAKREGLVWGLDRWEPRLVLERGHDGIYLVVDFVSEMVSGRCWE